MRNFIEKTGKQFCMISLIFSSKPSVDFAKLNCQVSCLNGKMHYLVAVEEKDKENLLLNLKSEPLFLRALQIPVCIPFHTKFLSKVVSEFDKLFDKNPLVLSCPSIPIISNVTGKYFDIANGTNEILHHLTEPVLWEKSIEFSIKQGMKSFLNMGPGNSMSALISREHTRLTETFLDIDRGILK